MLELDARGVSAIATAFDDLSSFQLLEWLDEGNPTNEEESAILEELATRATRRAVIADLLFD